MEQKTWWKCITYPERIDYVSFQNNEYVFVAAVEKLLELEIPREGDVDAHAPLRAEPHPLAPRLARHVGARAGCDLDVLVRVPRARADPRPVRARDRVPHAHAVLPGRRARRGHPARLLSRGAQVLRMDAARGRRLRDAAHHATRSGSSAPRASGCSRPRTRSRSASPARCCAAPASTGTCGRTSRTSPTARSTSTCRSTRQATCTRATACTWTRCASRCASSSSASTGSSRWTASRGSRTTARSCCRRGTSCTRRWSR